jgi:hypothetical protein
MAINIVNSSAMVSFQFADSAFPGVSMTVTMLCQSETRGM